MLQDLSFLTSEGMLSLYDNLEFLVRILLSGVFGAVIGLERTFRAKEAGIRTHCIIAISSAAFMILSKYAFLDMVGLTGVREVDPARLAAQVVSGISFLGAGVIFKHNASIKGLTTAAGMWATAAVGMAVGAGMYWLGLMATAAVVLVQLLLHRFPVAGDDQVTCTLDVRMEQDPAAQAALDMLIKKHGAVVEKTTISREGALISLHMELRLTSPIDYREVQTVLEENKSIYTLSV